jgi:hypothetical protein
METTRQTIINRLVDNLIDFVFEGDNRSYLAHIFESEGWKPFNQYTNKELEAEYLLVFNEVVVVEL